MALVTTIHGFDKVMTNLNVEIRMMTNRSMAGLIQGAQLVFRDTEKTPPLTPVDLGNMRASRFIVTAKTIPRGRSARFKDDITGQLSVDHFSTISEAQSMVAQMSNINGQFLILGYSAHYTLFVHENLGASSEERYRYGPGPGKKRLYRPRAGAGPKWFEASFKRNSGNIVALVRNNARIKR